LTSPPEQITSGQEMPSPTISTTFATRPDARLDFFSPSHCLCGDSFLRVLGATTAPSAFSKSKGT
jgi:hypothetical protein